MNTVEDCLDILLKRADSIITSTDSDQINILQTMFRDLEVSAREKFQEKLYGPAQNIVRKLQRGEDLSRDEEKVLELLIIGDADYYTRVENNYEDWLVELRRLLGDLSKMKRSDASIEELCHLRAMARDALNLLPSMVFYIKARDRVQKFRQAMRGSLEIEDKMMLASIVITALESELQ